ncbi:uncharacterized protein TRIADDRAFT_52327 [Trichoplax adhaerens]|uniref:Uncharacterized protein n=1 Tax=Trichoplax adhaerens TaxID=10228 RepID=B3RHZ5_TRIAD|nr:predicted protein [Trichoplax adhaerens]EDV29675.1 predicted protein [Trichoplax adhaerens]|eukprot:XP_002108877.1 predicted protein [Trichoplax adhaerens]
MRHRCFLVIIVITAFMFIIKIRNSSYNHKDIDISKSKDTDLNGITFTNNEVTLATAPPLTFESNFTSIKIPMVIFCSYRHEYMSRLLRSLRDIDGLHPNSTCLFACQKSPVVKDEDIKKTNQLIAGVKFCKTKTIITQSKRRNAKEYKQQWYNVVKQTFEDKDIFGLGSVYEEDVLFLEDDIELSKDAIKMIWYMLQIKNSRYKTVAVGLGGWSGENLVNPHPDTVVIRYMLFFPGMAYAFNASVWREIKTSRFLTIKVNDWSEALGWLWVGRYNVIVPTLGRIWHIGAIGLGHTGDGKKRRRIEPNPAWSKSPRLVDLNKITLNTGERDLFGMYCNPSDWTPYMSVKCMCPKTRSLYPNRKHFQIVCVKFPGVYDKCIGRDP